MKNFPTSTYRVQLNDRFTLGDLRSILPYLKELGISTIYTSPLTAAFAGSNHGYDVTNSTKINPEIGTESDLQEIANFLQKNEMNWLQDIVPNHMVYDVSNDWLSDVMERGTDSPFAYFFDINWDHPDLLLNGKLMAPFLGRDLTAAIEEGEIKLKWQGSGFVISYFEHIFPVAITTYERIFSELKISDDLLLKEISSLLNKKTTDMETWNDSKRKFLEKINTDKERVSSIEQGLQQFNQEKFLLETLINKQNIALVPFRKTKSTINYRRFFTVNSLICLRMEDERVFDAYHQYLFSLYNKKLIQGFRVDHIDGLYEPGIYIDRLRKAIGDDGYIVVEKILQTDETIPVEWKIQGTTGYDLLGSVNQLMINRNGLEKISKFYDELEDRRIDFSNLVFDRKHTYLEKYMGGEVDNLYELLKNSGSFGKNNLEKGKIKEAIKIFIAAFPIYRLYETHNDIKSESILRKTFLVARANGADLSDELNFLRSLFGLPIQDQLFQAADHFIKRLMQLTGPVAAKGVEDTAFYRYNKLISQNEVGDSPGTNHFTADDFHRAMQRRLARSPHTMNTTSTHDTKRGEDNRIRISTLTMFADEWISLVRSCLVFNKPFVSIRGSRRAPTLNDEYFIYQSILGALPPDGQCSDNFKIRMHSFITKAIREADQETSYHHPNLWYERNCHAFIDHIFSPENNFLKTFLPFSKKIIVHAAVFSLSQLLIKICSPGIPDLYQGSELWDLHLVDPDNRGPVDFEIRKKLSEKLNEPEKKSHGAMLLYLKENWITGVQKLFVIRKTLALRKKFPALFAQGEYIPVSFFEQQDLFSFMRKNEKNAVAIIVPLPKAPSIEKINFIIPDELKGNWQNEFTGESIFLQPQERSSDIFAHFPIALLTKKIIES
jgi:(1->4)-alpha-D-glucan 1-alpha-D-glucosylmutase